MNSSQSMGDSANEELSSSLPSDVSSSQMLVYQKKDRKDVEKSVYGSSTTTKFLSSSHISSAQGTGEFAAPHKTSFITHPISPIPKMCSSRSKKHFDSQRYREFSSRGLSPLVSSPVRSKENVDPQLTSLKETPKSDKSSGNALNPSAESLQINSHQHYTQGATSSDFFESGYASTGLGQMQRSDRSPLAAAQRLDSASLTTSELKYSQLQGTSTPRSRLVSKLDDNNCPNSSSDASTDNITPDSAMAVTNPFDSCLLASLHKHTCSPSVFHNVRTPSGARKKRTPSEESEFRWSIDHMAQLFPVDIPEFPHDQHHVNAGDPHFEAQMDQAINHFWSNAAHVVPSPFRQCKPRIQQQNGSIGAWSIRSALNSAERAMKKPVRTVSECTQTNLTFPPNLDLERLLGGCFVFNEGSDSQSASSDAAANLSVTSLRRKLFSCPRDLGQENIDNATAEGAIESGSSFLSAMDDEAFSPDPWNLDELDGLDGGANDSNVKVEDCIGEPLRRTHDDTTNVLSSPEISPIKHD